MIKSVIKSFLNLEDNLLLILNLCSLTIPIHDKYLTRAISNIINLRGYLFTHPGHLVVSFA